MGKMKERTIELSDLARKLTSICAVSNYGKKVVQVASENGERLGWINTIKDTKLKTFYVCFVADINWETETITYYASMPYTDVVLIPYNVFGMCDEPDKYRILSINTRTHNYTLFNSNCHTDWLCDMFRWMGDYYMKLNAEDIQKINESKTNEEVTTMSELKIKEQVIFNAPATVVFWSDKSKQVLKCREQDEWDEEKALALAIAYKLYGKKEFNELLKNARRITDDSKAKITVLNTTETNDEVCDCGNTCSCKVTCTKNGIESCTGSTTAESNIINELIIEIRNLRADVDKLSAKKKRKSKKNEKNEE